jgi:hypothetical protein
MVTLLQSPAMATEPPGYFYRLTVGEILLDRIGDSVLGYVKNQFEGLILVKLGEEIVFVKKYKD